MGSSSIKETFFISHGSPTLCADDSLPAKAFFEGFRENLFNEKPKAILVISAHWDTSEPTVNVINGFNDTIHQSTTGMLKLLQDRSQSNHISTIIETYHKLYYPAPGAPELASRVKELLNASGFTSVDADKKRGLDHGAWAPLILMYPEADIPVCQLSIQTQENATHHYNMGRALAPLKDEGVLIIGSGFAAHNVRLYCDRLESGTFSVDPLTLEFDTWLKDALLSGSYEEVNQFQEKAPNANHAHPEPDHIYPLHVALGAAGEYSKAELIHHSWTGCLSYASYKFVSID